MIIKIKKCVKSIEAMLDVNEGRSWTHQGRTFEDNIVR